LLLDIFTPKAPPLLGMDLSSSAVKMVELTDAGRNTHRVERYAVEPLPKDSVLDGNITNLEAVAETVRRAWKKLDTRTKNVAMALPTAAVITKKITCPAGLREEELEIQVESEANQYIPFALDEVNLDFQVLGPAASGAPEVEVLIAASRKEKVEDRVAVAEAAGLKALVMDVDSYAMQAAFDLIRQQLPNEGRDQNVAVVDLGASVMNITVLRNDQAVFAREQGFGGYQLTQDIAKHYGLSIEEAENAKRSGGLPDSYQVEVLRPFMENAATEIQRAMQFFFTSTQYNSLDHILLTGGTSTLPGFEDLVSSRLRVNAMVANPFANMSISPRVQLKKLLADAPALMIACGLAMRRFDQ
jgi:type IV pilus assembly protein PilM